MDYINYVKEKPFTGYAGFGGGAGSFQFHSGSSKATAFRGNRAVLGFLGTAPSGYFNANIKYYNLSSTGNASNFGNLYNARNGLAAMSGNAS